MDCTAETEKSRDADFRACPILADYISTMLQDAQYTEDDEACMEEREPRDTGTIYTLREEEYQKAKRACERFMAENAEAIEEALELEPGEDGLRYTSDYISHERIGSTFYMVRVGHGVGFTDDDNAECLQRLNEAARKFGSFDVMIGDDEEVYTM